MWLRIPFYIHFRSGRFYVVKKIQNRCTLCSVYTMLTPKAHENKMVWCNIKNKVLEQSPIKILEIEERGKAR
jgi:hypothetical protein